MGRLFRTIPSDQKENTLIIFLGDNGTPGKVIQVPYEINRSKGSLHQGGLCIIGNLDHWLPVERDQV